MFWVPLRLLSSQQNIQNALYKICFGSRNNCGIHGACPMEMLHALLLGIFKYARDCLFKHEIGDSSQLVILLTRMPPNAEHY